MIPLEFGPRLKESRRAKHLRQHEISRLLHISRQAYSNYEQGRCSPPVHILAELTILLDTDFFSLFLNDAQKRHSNLLKYITNSERKNNAKIQ